MLTLYSDVSNIAIPTEELNMKYITEEQFDAHIERLIQDSRDTRDDGEINYPYIDGLIQQMLKSSLTSEVMREITIRHFVEDK